MSEAAISSRRMGGRAARHKLRAAPLREEEKAVRPGMIGGRFRPLDESGVQRIHTAALDVLEHIGLSEAIPTCIEAVTAAGGQLSPEGRLLFPRALVEDAVANAARDIVLHGQDPRHDLELSGNKVYFGTAGAAVHIVDPHTREYRESTLADLYDIARLVDTLEHIHFFQRSIVCRDLEDPRETSTSTPATPRSPERRSTSDRAGCSPSTSTNRSRCSTGSRGTRRAGGRGPSSACRAASWCRRCVSPRTRAAASKRRCAAACRCCCSRQGQAGATSPAALAGAVVQEVAEVLAGLVYVNALSPGHPAIFGTWPFVSDLRTGAMSGGSGEQAVLMAACAQMGRFYDLPTGIAAGMADSKLPDAQAGYEKGYTTALAGHSGANLVYESAGMLGSLLGACLESFVIDNDMLGAVNRSVRGVNIDDESLSVESMREVCMEGPNHFLGHPQTLGLMQREYVYPEVGDRASPKEWGEQGSSNVVERASKRVRETLARHYPTHIPRSVDAELRKEFRILLEPPAGQ